MREPAPGPFLLLSEVRRASVVGWGLPWQSWSFGKHPALPSHKKPRAGPSQQHPNFSSKPQEEIFAQGRVFAALTAPALLRGPSHGLRHTNLPFPPAKAGPRHLHLKSVPSRGLLLPARPPAPQGRVLPSGLITAAPILPSLIRALLISTQLPPPCGKDRG